MKKLAMIFLLLVSNIFGNDNKVKYFLQNNDNLNKLNETKAKTVLNELVNVTAAFNVKLDELILLDTVWVSSGTSTDYGAAQELYFESGGALSTSEAAMLSTKEKGTYEPSNRRIFFDKEIVSKIPEWNEVLDYYGGYAEIGKTGINKSNYQKKFKLTAKLKSIELVSKTKSKVFIEINASKDAKAFYGLEDNITIDGLVKIKNVTFVDLFYEYKRKILSKDKFLTFLKNVDDYSPVITFSFPDNNFNLKDEIVFIGQLSDQRARNGKGLEKIIKSYGSTLDAIINDLITDDEYEAARQDLTLDELHAQRKNVSEFSAAKELIKQRVLKNSIPLHTFNFFLHHITTSRFLEKNLLYTFLDYQTPITTSEYKPSPDYTNNTRLGFPYNSKSYSYLEDRDRCGGCSTEHKHKVVWESHFIFDFLSDDEWGKIKNEDYEKIYIKSKRKKYIDIILNKQIDLFKSFYPLLSVMDSMMSDQIKLENDVFNIQTMDGLHRFDIAYNVFNEKYKNNIKPTIDKLVFENRVPLYDPYLFQLWLYDGSDSYGWKKETVFKASLKEYGYDETLFARDFTFSNPPSSFELLVAKNVINGLYEWPDFKNMVEKNKFYLLKIYEQKINEHYDLLYKNNQYKKVKENLGSLYSSTVEKISTKTELDNISKNIETFINDETKYFDSIYGELEKIGISTIDYPRNPIPDQEAYLRYIEAINKKYKHFDNINAKELEKTIKDNYKKQLPTLVSRLILEEILHSGKKLKFKKIKKLYNNIYLTSLNHRYYSSQGGKSDWDYGTEIYNWGKEVLEPKSLSDHCTNLEYFSIKDSCDWEKKMDRYNYPIKMQYKFIKDNRFSKKIYDYETAEPFLEEQLNNLVLEGLVELKKGKYHWVK